MVSSLSFESVFTSKIFIITLSNFYQPTKFPKIWCSIISHQLHLNLIIALIRINEFPNHFRFSFPHNWKWFTFYQFRSDYISKGLTTTIKCSLWLEQWIRCPTWTSFHLEWIKGLNLNLSGCRNLSLFRLIFCGCLVSWFPPQNC